MEHLIQKEIRTPHDGRIAVDVYGDPARPGIILLPGVMSDAATWRRVARALTAWPSATVVNRRGRAPSSPLGPGYAMEVEEADLASVLDVLGDPRALFGWSYGGTIALLLASHRRVEHLIAYEPVDPGFGRAALPGLLAAGAAGDDDAIVEIVNREVSGFDAEHVRRLRSDARAWSMLRRLGRPAPDELDALSRIALPEGLGAGAGRIDLILGAENQGQAPYGTSFEVVRDHLPTAVTHLLAGQGHLAHIEDPVGLARLIDALAPSGTPAASGA